MSTVLLSKRKKRQPFFVCTFQLFYQVLTQKYAVGSHLADRIRVSICQVPAEYRALSG